MKIVPSVLTPPIIDRLWTVAVKARAAYERGERDYDFNPKFTCEWHEMGEEVLALFKELRDHG